MEIKEININELHEYENNPRQNENAVEAVAASIREFGFKVPIVIDADNVIVAGHTRLKAAKLLGLDKVPCIVADDLTPEQVKAFRVADNKTAELAEWDIEKLEIELAELSDFDFDMSVFGFVEQETEPTEIIEDEPPEVDEESEPVAKLGDIWKLGQHRLMCGDSTIKKDVKKLMNGATADMVFTDPPYNVNYEGKTKEKLTIQNDKKDSRGFYQFLYDAFTVMGENIKQGGAMYVCHAHMESINFIASFQAAGFYLSQMLVWNKSTMALGRSDYQWKHEPILYGWKEGAAHYFIDDRTQTTVIEDNVNINKLTKDELKDLCKKLMEDHRATTIINEDKPSINAEHPTMKPVKLVARFIRNSSRNGEIVLDTFGGSGSTLLACEQLNRTCYTMELDPKYCDVIIKRWETFTGQKAELIK